MADSDPFSLPNEPDAMEAVEDVHYQDAPTPGGSQRDVSEPRDDVQPNEVAMEDADADAEAEPEAEADDIDAKGEDDPIKEDEDDEDGDDLFGDEERKHEPTGSSPTPSLPASEVDGISSPERRRRKALEYEEEEEPPEAQEQVIEATVPIPNLPVPKTADGNYWTIRMSNFVKLDSKPFHPDTYTGPEQYNEDGQPAESLRERSMSIKLEVENTVRWKWVKGPDGEMRKQTNSRIIRWSDGSMSLLLGKELFDIQANADIAPSTPRGSQRASQPSQSQSSSQPTPGNYIRSQGLTYLVAQHKRAEILQAEALVSGFYSIRPTSMQSETHKMLVRAVGQKHNKVARLRMAPEMSKDSDRELADLQKSAAKSRAKRPKADDLGGKLSKRKSGGGRGSKRGGEGLYSDEDDAEFAGSDEERESSPKKKRTTGEYEADDFVVEDSDSDYDGGKSHSKRRKSAKEEVEADSLDEMDASIERQRKKEKATKVTPTKTAMDVDDDAMDVAESEDEEEDIRRIGTGSRKKIIYDDDEEDEE
ncbi:hypothetical protein BOTBODRAFT_154157 [Botryobasidium botryosum FD-172 SS1]|uniref:Leo1-like protein n=1 Tax=Botryobasidium botryosum (strain FD-172 SS1) TaxID=930990 RepID=A0A067MWW1_BOTB1|nr:hypothetical protein BOTBODRAFT_154157 [Botryobasidium botryosum FD-172 SS1]